MTDTAKPGSSLVPSNEEDVKVEVDTLKSNQQCNDEQDHKDLQNNVSSSSSCPSITGNSHTETPPPQTLSKKQLRKLERKKRWAETKDLRRAKTKQKKKERMARVKQGLVDNYIPRKKLKMNTMKNSGCKVGVAIDMSFDHLMNDKDLAKCIKQIHRCYSINRKLQDPLQFYITSFGGIAEQAVGRHTGWQNWDINFTPKSCRELEQYPLDRLVYLSSESGNVLEELKPDHLYIIGGLVDHNSHKGLCHSVALKKGISHARLPISEYLEMKTRKVLTINHVFEILTNVTQNIPWDKSLLDVIAPRKMAQAKQASTEESGDSSQ